MSFLLDIVIPKDEMNKVGLEEQLIEWGGAKFSQEPPKYIGNKELVFEELTNLKYHCGLLGNDLDAEKYNTLLYCLKINISFIVSHDRLSHRTVLSSSCLSIAYRSLIISSSRKRKI